VKQQLKGLFFPAPLFAFKRELLSSSPSAVKSKSWKLENVNGQLSYQGTESKLRIKKEDLRFANTTYSGYWNSMMAVWTAISKIGQDKI
jgi:hypothetical protein